MNKREYLARGAATAGMRPLGPQIDDPADENGSYLSFSRPPFLKRPGFADDFRSLKSTDPSSVQAELGLGAIDA